MDAYYNLPQGFRERVSDTYIQSVQQNDSKFRDAGIVIPDWIATQYVERITAPVEFTETTGQRGGDTQQGEYQVGFRSGFIRDFEIGIDFDINDRDRLYTADRPDSQVQRDMVSAWNRRVDDIFIDAAQELSYGGVKPYITPAASLPTQMEIPVTWDKVANGVTNTNFTVWKLEEAIQRMLTQNVDLDREKVNVAIPPKVRQAWFQYAMSAPSSAFALEFLPWYHGKTDGMFMGYRMIVSTRLRFTGSIYNCLVYTNTAFRMSPPKFDMRIDIRTDKRHATQIVVYAKMGCFRLYDEKVNIAYSDTAVAITY
jgi:hypothetical protein